MKKKNLNKKYTNAKNNLIFESENKLTYNLYLTGNEVSKENEDLYNNQKMKIFLRKEFSNLYKWKLLMKKNLPSL